MRKQLACLKNVSARVTLGNGEDLQTVKQANMTIESGHSYAIVGKSGSGKTSLISILGLLNRNYTGEYYYNGTNVADLRDHECSKLRAKHIGFVFQNYSLIQHLSVSENINLALQYSGVSTRSRLAKDRTREVLKTVGLSHRAGEFPNKLSGGEQQRVAIARALVVSPELLICDEPTGALDAETSNSVMDILQQLVSQESVALVLVTHDADIAALCDTIYTMDNGVILSAQNAH